MHPHLSERDVCTKLITPAITAAGWDLHDQIREEVGFTKGRVRVKGKVIAKGKDKRADYILYYKPGIPIAVIEAKDNLNHTIGDGIQQAIDYAAIQDIPFAYSSNGEGFLEHDRTKTSGLIERKFAMSEFPSPDELWERYKAWKSIDAEEEKVVEQDYFLEPGKEPRYYQIAAVNKTIEAIAKGQNRILLVMATGTGKTFTAFQIIWRLWKSKTKKRILYLADRNILIDQTMVNDFKPFGSAMTKIRDRRVDKSYEIYLALYQGMSGQDEAKNIYKQFSKGFFDLIIVDECHRGSAAEDSAWREILEYYSTATQIGLTATPKQTAEASNVDYFGEPVYTYTLKQGIEDGFLAPYKVIRIDIDKDMEDWQPTKDLRDNKGRVIPYKAYKQKGTVIFEKRINLVANKISDFLKQTDRFAKTIIFCEDIDHAERMRSALANENSDLVAQNSKYVMRITGDDRVGKMELDNFINPESKYPVIATTSKLMTTGVDAQTCKVIVLDRTINSMPEFKQIIGRGTRLKETFGKWYFTIIDFRNATKLFRDPEFDGEPVRVYEPPKGGSPVPPEDLEDDDAVIDQMIDKGSGRRDKYVIEDEEVTIVGEHTEFYGWDGKTIGESLMEFTRRIIREEFETLESFLQRWSVAKTKREIIGILEAKGVLWSKVETEVSSELDAFDMILHIAFDQPTKTRHERAQRVRELMNFKNYNDKARGVLEALLVKYANEGIENIESMEVLNVPPIPQFGSPVEIIRSFGGKEKYTRTVKELIDSIYSSV